MIDPQVRLVLRADDAGSCPEANRAIAACLAAGAVRCVSVMAPCAYVSDAAELLGQYPKADIGLHVTLNSEWESVKWGPVMPAERVPSLVDRRGNFLPLPPDLKARGVVVEQAMLEVAAQLGLLRQAGLDPVYLDEHCFVGWISEDLVSALEAFAKREGLLAVTRCLNELPEGEDFTLRVRTAPPGDYLSVFHPGEYETAGLMRRFYLAGEPEDGSVARERDAERRLLCHPEFVRDLTDAGATIASYTEVLTR